MIACLVLDVDAVLVDSPHERAWREVLAELMVGEWGDIRPRTTWTPTAFSGHVYQRVTAGLPREDGALATLTHFGVPDAEGGSRSTPGASRPASNRSSTRAPSTPTPTRCAS